MVHVLPDSSSKLDEMIKIADSPLHIEMPVFEQDDSATVLMKADSLLRATKQQLLDVKRAVEKSKSSPRINIEKMPSLSSHSRQENSDDSSPQHERGLISATVKGVVADYKAHFLTGPLDSRKERSYQMQNKNEYNNVTMISDQQHKNEGNPGYNNYLGHHHHIPLQEEMLKTQHSIQEALNTAKGVSSILSDRCIPDMYASNSNKPFQNLNKGPHIYQEDKRNIQARGNVHNKLNSSDYGYNSNPVLKEQTTAVDKTKFFVVYDQMTTKPHRVENACFCTNCSHIHPLGTNAQAQNVPAALKNCECENCRKNAVRQNKLQVMQQETHRNPERNATMTNYNACSCEANKNVSNFQGNLPKTNCDCRNDYKCKERKITLDFKGKSSRTNCNCVETCTCKDKNNTLHIQGKSSVKNHIKACECEKEKNISDVQRKDLKYSCQNKCTCGENICYTKCSNSAMVHVETCVGDKETPQMMQLCSEGKLIIQALPSLSIKRNLSVQKIPTVRIPPPGAPPYVSATKNVALWGVSHSQIELDLWDCSPRSCVKKSDIEVKHKSSKGCERKYTTFCEEPVVYKKKKARNPCNLVFQTMPTVELGAGNCNECNGYLSKGEIQVGHCLSCTNKSQHEPDKESVCQRKSSQIHQSPSEMHKAQCNKCKKAFFIKDLYCGICKHCCNLSIRNEISRICMSTATPDFIKAAAHLEQCDECHRYFPISELFQGHCIACQITKEDVRLYQCDICLNSIPSTEYFEGKCDQCYQMLVYGTRNEKTIPRGLTMVQQSLQSVFDGTPFLFDLNVAQGINRTVHSAKSTYEIRRHDATFTVYPMARDEENSRPKSLVQEEGRKFDNGDKEKRISHSKDKRSSVSKETTKRKLEANNMSSISKIDSYTTWLKNRESELKETSEKSTDVDRDSDLLNNGNYSDSSKIHSGFYNERSEKQPTSKTKRESKMRYMIDIDKEDINIFNNLIDIDRSHLSNQSVQFRDLRPEIIGTQENDDPEPLTYQKYGKGNYENSDSSESDYEKRNVMKRRATPYFGRKEAQRLSQLFSSIIQKTKDSDDVNEDRNSSTSVQSQSDEHPNKLSQWEAQRLSLTVGDVMESEEADSENTAPETIPIPKGTSMFNKNTLRKTYEEKVKISDMSSSTSETKSNSFSNMNEKNSKKEQETQTADRKTAGSQTMSLLTAEVLERRFSTKTVTQKSISDALHGVKMFEHAVLMPSFHSAIEDDDDKHQFDLGESIQEDGDGESENKLQNDFVKNNLEGGLGSSLTSGTDAKVEEGSLADDKTTVTEGDDIYEDDWEEESDKGDYGDKSDEKDDTSSDAGVIKEVKISKEDHKDSTALSSFPTSGSENNETDIYPGKKWNLQNLSTSSKKYSELQTNFIVQTVQTHKVCQKTARTCKKKAQTCQEKIPDISLIPLVPCDVVWKEKNAQEIKNVMKCSETSATLKKNCSDKVHVLKPNKEYPVIQVKTDKCSGIPLKQKKVDRYGVCKKPRVTKVTKRLVTSDVPENNPQDQVYGAERVEHNFPCVKKRTKCQFDNPYNIERNVEFPAYQLKNHGNYSTVVPCVTDKSTAMGLPPPVETIDISTSPICINVTDRGTSVTNLMAENLVERETSPIKISYLEASTSPLSLPAMIDKQLSSANFGAWNLIDNETSPIPSVKCINKSTSPIRNSFPEKKDRGTSITCISKDLTDSEISPIQSEECICKSISPTNISLPEKLNKDVSVISTPKTFTDKETSPVHSIGAICKSTSVMRISIPEKMDRDTSVTCIPGNLVDKETSPIPSKEYVCESTIPPQEKNDTLLVCTSSECTACKKMVAEQMLVKSDLKNNFPSKCSREGSSNKLVSHCKSIVPIRTEFDEQPESDGETVDSSVCKQKKTARFKQLPLMMKQHKQKEDSELSDDEPYAVKSISHRQMTVSEGELLSCSVCSQEDVEDVSASLTKSTATNAFSAGEVFSCQCFEDHCVCSEGEIARDHRRMYCNSDISVSQKKDAVQLLISSSVEDGLESSEESDEHKSEQDHKRMCKVCAAHRYIHKEYYSEGELSETSEDLSDGQIFCID